MNREQLKSSPLAKMKKCLSRILNKASDRNCTYRYCVTGVNFSFIVESSEVITAIEAATRAIECVFTNAGNAYTVDGRNPSIGEFLWVHSSVFDRHVFVYSEIVLANAGHYMLANTLRLKLKKRDSL